MDRESKAPEYWKYVFIKGLQHELSVYKAYGGNFAFRYGDWNFARGNANRTTAQWGNDLLDFLNWSDKVETSPDPQNYDVIYSDPFYLENKFLPGFSQVSLFPDGQAEYDAIIEQAKIADKYFLFLKQYQLRWLTSPPNRAYWEVQGTECNRRIALAMETVRQIAVAARNKNSKPGQPYPSAPYEIFYVDRANWFTTSKEAQDLYRYRDDLLNSVRKRAGFVSTAEVFDKLGQVLSALGAYNSILTKATLLAGAVVTGGALAGAIAPTVGAGIGVSTGTAATAIQAGTVALATGGNPLSVISPVVGEAAKNITGGEKVGFLDGIKKTVGDVIDGGKGVSFAEIGSSISSFTSNLTGGDVLGSVGGALAGLTPNQVISAVAPAQNASPVAAVPKTTSAIPATVKAAIPMGVVLGLIGIYLYSKGK